ncbi:hypothetical protein [Nonomuraea jabiensis]|uniref:hypothetical protein n=1 Tax=Nonomuraea jabiensis TaxID=882448 RepID=UPI003D74A1EA
MSNKETLSLSADCAERAERVRRRGAEVAGRFAEGVRTLVAQGKPVAITEYGTKEYT